MGISDKWQKELEFLTNIISETELEKAIKWGGDVYTIDNSNVLSIRAFKDYVSIWFFNGVFLEDAHKVLENAQEGKTKALRHWKFTSLDEIDEKKIMDYVREAIENEKKGLRWKPEKSEELEVPDLLKVDFNSDAAFQKAFFELTPSKQKEYAEYIDKAKREATKLSRLEKIRPMILEGVGLNDKYRK